MEKWVKICVYLKLKLRNALANVHPIISFRLFKTEMHLVPHRTPHTHTHQKANVRTKFLEAKILFALLLLGVSVTYNGASSSSLCPHNVLSRSPAGRRRRRSEYQPIWHLTIKHKPHDYIIQLNAHIGRDDRRRCKMMKTKRQHKEHFKCVLCCVCVAYYK